MRQAAAAATTTTTTPAAEAATAAQAHQMPLVTALPALSLSLLFPRLGEVPFFDLMTSPRDQTGVESVFPQVRIGGLVCNGTRRRRRAERLSRLPMGVVPDAGAEVLASAPAKGGKHPAVDTFRGVDPGAARAPRPIGLRSGWSVPRTSDKTPPKKSRRLKRARSKNSLPVQNPPRLPFNINNNNHQSPDQSLLKALVPERESETNVAEVSTISASYAQW